MLFALADIGYRGPEGNNTVRGGMEAISTVYPPVGGTYFCGFIVASSTRSSDIMLQAVFNSCNFDRRALLAATTCPMTAVNLQYRSKQV